MIRFEHEKILMTDRGRLLKNRLAIIRDGNTAGERHIELVRRRIRAQALTEGEEFVMAKEAFWFRDGEDGIRDFSSSIVPLPQKPELFTGETKRILLSLEVWDGPWGDRTESFPNDSECEIWVIPTPPQLELKMDAPFTEEGNS